LFYLIPISSESQLQQDPNYLYDTDGKKFQVRLRTPQLTSSSLVLQTSRIDRNAEKLVRGVIFQPCPTHETTLTYEDAITGMVKGENRAIPSPFLFGVLI
jgi:hypothetical protein